MCHGFKIYSFCSACTVACLDVEKILRQVYNKVNDWYYSLLLLLSTCACVEYYGRALEILVKKVPVHCIHGKMKHKRNKIFADFRALKRWDWLTDWLTVCVCVYRCSEPDWLSVTDLTFLSLCFVSVGSWCVQMWWPEASISPMLTGCCSTILPAAPGNVSETNITGSN